MNKQLCFVLCLLIKKNKNQICCSEVPSSPPHLPFPIPYRRVYFLECKIWELIWSTSVYGEGLGAPGRQGEVAVATWLVAKEGLIIQQTGGV